MLQLCFILHFVYGVEASVCGVLTVIGRLGNLFMFVAFLFMISLRAMSRIKANMRLLIHIKKLKRLILYAYLLTQL
ncbi:hypothetical protein Hdeb2414_s0002g00076431 [Helianthus debilis subsp. tardiflorus]